MPDQSLLAAVDRVLSNIGFVLLALSLCGGGAVEVVQTANGSDAQHQEPADWFHNQFAIETQPDADPDQIASEYGFINLGQIGSLNHHYLFEHPKVHKRSIEKSDHHFLNLSNHPHIKWFDQQ